MFKIIPDVVLLYLRKYFIKVLIISNLIIFIAGVSVNIYLYYSERINTYQPITVTFENNKDANELQVYGVSPFGRQINFQKVDSYTFRSYYSFFKQVVINPTCKIINPQEKHFKIVVGNHVYNYTIQENKTFTKPDSDRGNIGFFSAFFSLYQWTSVRFVLNTYIGLICFLIIIFYFKKLYKHIRILENYLKRKTNTFIQIYNKQSIYKIKLFHALSGIFITCLLLAPGFWGGDALNAYIQGVTGKYASAQPVFLAFIFSNTHNFYQGALPFFLLCIALYFGGFSFLLFHFIKDRVRATLLFYILCLYPPLFANIGVVQTETFQIAVLSVFIPLTIMLYSQKSLLKWLMFVFLSILLCSFSLVRYDTLPVTIILAYWLVYTILKKHSIKTFIVTISLAISFYFAGFLLDTALGYNKNCKNEMRNAMMISDIAAISVKSNINYIPYYCWRNYLPPKDKTLNRINNRDIQWKDDFFSYLFNNDPSTGLFTYNTTKHSQDLIRTWSRVIFNHPFIYLQYRLKNFLTFLFNYNFNQTLWGGINYTNQNLTKINIDRLDLVDFFLKKHGNRFKYYNGSLILYKDDTPINTEEKNDLLLLINDKNASNITWMEHYSQIPRRVYNTKNLITHYITAPYFETIKKVFVFFVSIFICLVSLIIIIYYRKKVKHPFLRFSFLILCSSGIINIVQRFFTITDPIFRFGIISIIFLFFSFIILISNYKETVSYNND